MMFRGLLCTLLVTQTVLRSEVACDCGFTATSAGDSVLTLSNDLVDAEVAQRQCVLSGGNLARAENPQINTTFTQAMTEKYAKGLTRVWLFYDFVHGERCRFSKDPNENSQWFSTKKLGLLWYIDLFARNRDNSLETVFFCEALGSYRGKWRATVGKNCQVTNPWNGWTLQFSLYARNTWQVGFKELFFYRNSIHSNVLRARKETYSTFNMFENFMFVPDIHVLTGTRYSDRNPTTCQQSSMHYGIGWEQSRVNCTGQPAYYACQFKLVASITQYPCNSSVIVVSWTGLGSFIENHNLTAEVEVNVLELNRIVSRSPYAKLSTPIENLSNSTNYTVKVWAHISGCLRANISTTVTVQTLGNPPRSCFPTDAPTSSAVTTESVPVRNSNAANSDAGLIVGVIAAILLLLLLVGFVVLYKRRKGKKFTKSSSQMTTDPSDTYTLNGAVRSNEVYQNLTFEPQLSETMNPTRKPLFNLFKENAETQFRFVKEEFQSIEQQSKDNQIPYTVSQATENASRNRYKNIYPYNHARVVLNERVDNDYINAAYIPGYNEEKKFIATQGPKLETVNDFWLMVWQEKTTIILMLTGLFENGKPKCEQYWPERGTHKEVTPDFHVKTQQEVLLGGIYERKLLVSRNQESRVITQLQYTTWPDHGAPVTTTNMIYLRKMVEELRHTSAPIIVHCSAGVGRTGTYIAMDMLIDELNETGTVDVPQAILRMRQNRTDMIQNHKQYKYLYKLLMEHESLDVETDREVEVLQSMSMNEMNKIQETEYKLLMDWRYGEEWVEGSPHLKTYNNTAIGIWDEKTDAVNQFNASFVQEQGESGGFLASQAPDEEEQELFWRMVVQRGTFVVVDLIQCIPVSQNDSITCGELILAVQELKDCRSHCIASLQISSASKSFEEKSMTVVQVKNWRVVETPPNELELVKIIDNVQRTRTDKKCQSVLVMCSDGATRTGTFVALTNILDRLKTQKRVDMFRTVKDLRDMRPNMLNNQELYNYCYSVVLKYLNDFNTYSNFK